MSKNIQKNVSAIAPCYNEERTVGHVVKTLLKHKMISEIICVNDGSTDKTQKILNKYKNKIKIINFKSNKGKGYAVSQGVKAAQGPLVLLLDADLGELKASHITNLINPVLKGYRGCVGFPYDNFANMITTKRGGQRVYYKEDIVPLLDEVNSSGYGLEILLNKNINEDIKYVKLIGLGHLNSFKKKGKTNDKYNYSKSWIMDSIKTYLKTSFLYELFITIFK